jgi:hypothetical protein
MRSALLLVVAFTLVGAGHFSSVVRADDSLEDWERPVFPRRGASLHETLSGLHPPREGDYRVLVHKLEVLRTDVSPWEKVDVKHARKHVEFGEGQSFVIVAHRICSPAIQMNRWGGRSTDWFILRKNRLTAYEVRHYSYQCLQSNHFRPARGRGVETERALAEFIEETFPASRELSVQVYQKGIELAKVGRIEDAELALANGDTRFDPTGYASSDRMQGSKGRASNKSDMQAVRRLLVRAIQEAKDGRLSSEADGVASTQEEDDPVDELEQLREDSARQDQERRERWEREKDSRRFAETRGGWELVDEYRRRRGPAEGEVWLTYEEMQATKAERASQRALRQQPTRPAVAPREAARSASADEEPLFVESGGEWVAVTESRRTAGRRKGEVWVSWGEMQQLMIARQLDAQPRPAQPAPEATTDERAPRLVQEVEGRWKFVTAQQLSDGKPDGEVWLTLPDMRAEMDRRAAARSETQ